MNPDDPNYWEEMYRQAATERDRAQAACAELREACGMNNPWPVLDVLHTLANWCDHLGQVHDCDCCGYEVRAEGVKVARDMVVRFGDALKSNCGQPLLDKLAALEKENAELRNLLPPRS